MAWSNPTTWTAGQTVTAADMNTEVRDNFLHVMGTCGYLGTATSSYGVQPKSGYFMGARSQNLHIEGGSTTLTTAGTQAVSFLTGFTAAPYVTITAVHTTVEDNNPVIISVTTSGFVAGMSAAARLVYYIALGTDT